MNDKGDMGVPEEESFEALLEAYGDGLGEELKSGDKVDAKVISIGESSVYVSTGTKSDGVVDRMELTNEDGELTVAVDDTLTLYVVSANESEVVLSKQMSGAGSEEMLFDAFTNGTPVEGKVNEQIKGGFSVTLMGKRAFCPVSQIDTAFVENGEDYLGKSFTFLVTRIEGNGKNIVISRRKILEAELAEVRATFLETLSEGDTVEAKVIKLMPYGAFMELHAGVEGMAHISELSWSRVQSCEEAVKVGDVLPVKVLKVETIEGKNALRIALSVKQASQDPWELAGDTIRVGEQFSGKVVRIAPFGAFVEVAPGTEGLVHVSEMSYTKRILKPEDAVSEGETVQVVVKAIDLEKKRLSLSIRDAHGDPWQGVLVKYPLGSKVAGTVEKKESYGIFVKLEPGVTGLLPKSKLAEAANASALNAAKPGETLELLVDAVDEEKRRITLVSTEAADGASNWKGYTEKPKAKSDNSMGTMGELLKAAMSKKK
ncbi:30S ribosomal protein S1 [Desulfoluna limicola]|uniref:30S ribosomal protein S1 n=1 Tax=Desulfoluna limicola TaxID=2810562 RepID=A0ABM7PH36_9BACT|nr:30S ribosomal protein S1 [Desulfoluna limicola]BCS96505.1 30S ribosomal protein S1 [Desulfoluna limicola]